MSTLAYATFTTSRENAVPGTSSSKNPPGVGTYVDAMAALVPAETLTLHALIISVTTKTEDAKTEIIAPDTLFWAFFCLLATSASLYIVPRLLANKWDRLDYLRMLIPPLSFVGWTMLQRTTAFDALTIFGKLPEWNVATRTVVALFLGLILGFAASAMAYKADQK